VGDSLVLGRFFTVDVRVHADQAVVDAAREFVAREPNNRAGVYADHFIWRFQNLLGRTMWEFSGAPDEPRFLVIARLDRDYSAGRGSRPVPEESLPPELRERLIVYGALSTLDDGEPAGVALAAQAPGRDAVVALLEDERTGIDVFQDVDIHAWEFGGCR
jgi:hypothetical protein